MAIIPNLVRVSMGICCIYHNHPPDPSRGICEILDFLGLERPFEDGKLAVGEPFLEDLIAAELTGPDGGRYVAPEGIAIQVDIEGGLTEGGNGVAQGGALIRLIGALDDRPWPGITAPPDP